MRVIGLDLGKKSLGIAVSDPFGIIATGIENYRFAENNFQAGVNRLLEIMSKYDKVDLIVLGYPKNMDGSVGERAIMCERFKRLIEKHTHVSVQLNDERLTTRIATSYMIQADVRRKKRKENKDKMSAVVILQGYLDSAKK